MLLMIAALLVLILLVLCEIVRQLVRIADNEYDVAQEIRGLRLTARTRIGQASMQSGVETEEQRLTHLGRTSASRRVVVGGEEESQLHKDLNSTPTAVNDE